MVEVLSALPARPPTPPKTSSHAFFDGEVDGAQGRPGLLNTPGDSPSSTNESTGLRSAGRTKRVNFSPWTNYIKPPTFSNSTSASKTGLRSLPPSNECKPSKSILKTTNNTVSPSPSNEAPQTTESLAMLLESVTQQLAGESLSSRLDAYIHLLGALKAYEGVPEEQAMIGKLGLMTQFIQRDVCRDLEKGGPLETNLVIHALKLTIFLIWNQALSVQLSDDFRNFIVDQSINSLQDAKVPKSVLTHYMHILSTQNFPAKIMTNSRLSRILSVLGDVTDRVNGNGIVSQRLSVYQRVLTQSKTTMASQSALWIEHLISGLLHHLKDTRLKAISLGTQASVALGPNITVSNTIRDIFNKHLDQGRKLVSEICERMSRMMSSTESGVHVPQIWSIIVLLLRSKRFNIDQWEHFKEWVLVLQKCFNCSEPAIKAQAILGWNRFVYAISPSESTSHSMIRMLSKPILSQFERKKHDKPGAATSQLVLSSYYNLLYYAFRPSTSHQHLDLIWEEYITQPFANIFAPNPNLNERACRALSSLLWSPQPKVWTENKINEAGKIEPESLPSLDCKWVRSRIVSVLKVFEILFKSSIWDRGVIEESGIAIAWINLSRALSDASNKEIKPSVELMQAIASVLGLFQRLWNGAPSSLNASADEFLDRFRFLSTSFISAIGPLPFTEKLLLKTAQETFQTANTPTHRHSPTDTNLDTPFMHLLRLISSSPDLSEPSPSYLSLIDGLLEAASKGRVSRGSRLDFFEKCADTYSNEAENQSSSHPNSARYVWEATAKFAEDCLHSFPMETVRDRDGSVSRDYENIFKILSRGLRFPGAHLKWNLLLDAFVRVVRTERGDRSIAKHIVEPLAEDLKQLGLGQVCAPLKALINHALSLPYHQQNKPRSRSVGFHYGSPAPDQVLFPHKLLELVDKVLSESYQNFKQHENTLTTEVIESLTSFLGSGVLHFRSAVLERLQGPLALWLKDDSRHLTTENGADSRVLTACRTLTLAVANVLQTAVPHDDSSLHKLEVIISAGLGSVHRSTANRFIEMWNTTFGLQDSLTYPAAVLVALRKLEPYVELQLPSWPVQSDSQIGQTIPDFVDSQDGDMSQVIQKEISDRNRGDLLKVTRPTSFSSSPIVQAYEPAINTLHKKTDDLTPKRRLRHDDSQIQFIAVESSPSLRSDPESQLLTKRQREVKERQRGEAAIFLDGLRSSSPALPSPAKDANIRTPVQLPKLRNSGPTSEIPLTPTLAGALQENDDEFLGSSPTPGTKDKTQLDESKIRSSLSIQALVNCDSDPPSSPPELKRRSHGRGNVTRQISPPLQEAESTEPLNDGSNAGKDDCAGKPADSSETSEGNGPDRSHAGDPVTDQSAHQVSSTSNGQEEAPAILAQEPQTTDSTPADMVPDSFSDDLEHQVASQLEQDLELAADLDEIRETESQPEPPRNFPMTRKRKREAEAAAELSSTPDRGKRRSLRSSSAIAKEVAKDTSKNSENIGATSEPRQPAPSGEKVSTPSSSKSKQKGKPNLETGDVERSGFKRKSRRTNEGADDDHVLSPANSENPPQKKRRSLRLSGIAVSPVPEPEPVSKTSRTLRSRAKAADTAQDAAGSSEESPSGKSQDRPEAENTPQDSSHDPSVQAAEDVETGKTLAGSELATVTEAAVEDSKRTEQEEPVEKGMGTDVLMEDTDGGAPQETSDDAATKSYVSHEVQTDDALDKDDITGEAILDSLRQVLSNLKGVTLPKSVLREVDDVMFDIRVEAHEAARRHHD
ncbi:hypothetical protein VTN77DRAFT_6767 [Rasamsonia byssochlamydoides]|uniref:uncharacterized protein n=1 Tax=Rasamsonia byssochlamydoides TaxID=89139 RepID=UPI0037424B6E